METPSFSPPAVFNIADYFLGDRIREGRGDRIALRVGDRGFTYHQVQALARGFAVRFRNQGVEPGDRVLLALPDGERYVGALFGALRTGAAVVMVNPGLPAEEVSYFFDYTQAKVAVVDRGTGDPSGVLEVMETRGDQAPALLEASEVEPAGVGEAGARVHPTGPDDPAIWLFSGGTTGRPKAVVQTHRSFANTTERYGKGVLAISPDDLTLSVPKLYFGYATGTNLFFPFSVGATAALFPERCTVEVLVRNIVRHHPTLLVNVPTMVNHMVRHAGVRRDDLASLRLATSAGEALPPELHRRWNEKFGVELLDGLGTAEMWHVFVSNRPGDVRPGTLGRAVPGFDVRVRDDQGRDLPPGEVGTLWVRGDSLGLGYHDRPEETARAFRNGWYVSGDMITMDEEGWITYCGRSDDMLKVSGKWLSPKELESCLLAHPAVREVAVVGVPTAEGLVKPHAWVIPTDGVEPGPDVGRALQEWARARLQPYKYPRVVTFVSELPRTHLGKVDRGRLAREAVGSDPG
ncbi:MAG: benzoate-CoA ligase family protein [Gemmatimonadota bacterium]|jgi:benzoate-CoA ligase family protein